MFFYNFLFEHSLNADLSAFACNIQSQFTFYSFVLFLFLQNLHQNGVWGVRFSLFNLFSGSRDETACFLDYEDPDGKGSVTPVTEERLATTESGPQANKESASDGELSSGGESSSDGESCSDEEPSSCTDSPSIAQTSSEAELPVNEELSSDAELET